MKRLIFLLILLLACTPQLPNPAQVTSVTAVPTVDTDNLDALCIAATLRYRDWQQSIDALKLLLEREQDCGGNIPVETQLYTAYLGYGTVLEADDRLDVAREVYEDALELNPDGEEVQARLSRLGADADTTETPPAECDVDDADDLPDYTPTDRDFVRLGSTDFILDGEPFFIYGANYFPKDSPFRYFLTDTDLDLVADEMQLLSDSGINMLRIFLYNDDLFLCPQVNALPNADAFELLDGIIEIAAEHDLRLIVVLNNDPDLLTYPLYTNPEFVQEQTRFIVERYRDEPTIIAWDVRDRGDVDYRVGDFSQHVVLTWIAETIVFIREMDANHAVTAGWWQDAIVTAPIVDFVSFQFYGDYEDLRQEIANLKASANKPILLSAIGYSTFSLDEVTQRNLLFQAFEEVENNSLLGWMVYMAFDYPRTVTCVEPDCPGEGSEINNYGLWSVDYFRKLSLDAVEVMTGIQE